MNSISVRELGLSGLLGLAVLTGCSGMSAQQGDIQPETSEVFRCLDGNDNDYLEPGELQNTAGCDLERILEGHEFPDSPKRRAEKMITVMDVDGDDRISDREFRAWVRS